LLLPNIDVLVTKQKLDVGGAVTVTVSLMLAVHAIVNGNELGWTSLQTWVLLAGALVLLGVFLRIESRVPVPLMPLGIFRLHNLAVSNVACALWATGMFAWVYISALHMQLVLGYGPMQVGLAFVPGKITTAVFSLGLSAKLVMRFGVRKLLGVGLLMSASGLALFARAPIDGNFMTDILPSMILLGLGAGVAYNPLLLAAMSDVAESESGLASGIFNTSFMMGGALGLAILASLSSARVNQLLASGTSTSVALAGGYQVAFLVGAVCTAMAALLCAALLRAKAPARERASTSATAHASGIALK
jgi:MFS family permease